MVSQINAQSKDELIMHPNILKDPIDFTEFNELAAKYDDMNFAQLEKNNALILEIMMMEIPDTEASEKFNEDLNAEIQVN